MMDYEKYWDYPNDNFSIPYWEFVNLLPIEDILVHPETDRIKSSSNITIHDAVVIYSRSRQKKIRLNVGEVLNWPKTAWVLPRDKYKGIICYHYKICESDRASSNMLLYDYWIRQEFISDEDLLI